MKTNKVLNNIISYNLACKVDVHENIELLTCLESIYPAGTFIYHNRHNLEAYLASSDFLRHAKTVTIYHDSRQSAIEAYRVATQREPVNIAMSRGYATAGWKQLTGSSYSAYCDENPVTNYSAVSIYSETYLWHKGIKKEIAVLSLPAPALDTKSQPSFSYYVNRDGTLKHTYQMEHEHLARTIMQAVSEQKNNAFRGISIKRLIIPKYGLEAFLGALDSNEKQKARNAYVDCLVHAIVDNQEMLTDITICMSTYSDNTIEKMVVECINQLAPGLTIELLKGDIKEVTQDGDLVVNAWDPHSNPGNGNEGDASFDGHMGRSSGILLTQTILFNPYMQDPGICTAVTSRS